MRIRTIARRQTRLLAALLLLSACAVCPAEQIVLPGPWFDQDKYHLPSESSWGDSWGHGWFDDLDGDGQYDPGEPYGETSGTGWLSPLYVGDGSCWMAAGANNLRYVGGPDRYHAWAYTDGIYIGPGDVRFWPQGGPSSGTPLENEGYATEGISWNGGAGWTDDLPAWIAMRLRAGIPVILGIPGHVITCYGLDTATNTVTLADSDTDLGAADFGTGTMVQVSPGFWELQGFYGSAQELHGTRAFTMNGWQGSGTGGNTSLIGAATDWANAANWAGGAVPGNQSFPHIEFANAGTCKVSGEARAMKCLLSGALTTVEIEPTAAMNVTSLQVTDARLLIHSGVLPGGLFVQADLIDNGTILSTGGWLDCNGTAYVALRGSGSLQMDGGRLETPRLYVGDVAGDTGDVRLALDGHIVCNEQIWLGVNGRGTLVQNGGTVDGLALNVALGIRGGAHGRYEIWDGAMAAQSIIAGCEGTGAFIQNGGTVTAGRVIVGQSSDSILNDYMQQGGNLVVNGPLTVASSGGRGRFHLWGGNLTTNGTDLAVSGRADFSQFPGTTHTVDGTLRVGMGRYGTASYDLEGGTLTTDMSIVGGWGEGAFRHVGGQHEIAGDLSLAEPDMPIAGGVGAYELRNPGQLEAENEYIGRWGTGTFNHLSGTNTIRDTLYVGCEDGSSGTYTQGGGQTAVAGRVVLGLATGSTGTFNLNAGTLTVGEGVEVGPRGTGILALGGGTLTGSGTLVVNESHGTLRGYGTIDLAVQHEGELIVPGATLALLQDFTGSGEIEIQTGGMLQVWAGGTLRGLVTNDGFLDFTGGTARLTGNVTGGGTLNVGGTLEAACDLGQSGAEVFGRLVHESGSHTYAMQVHIRPGGAYELQPAADLRAYSCRVGNLFQQTGGHVAIYSLTIGDPMYAMGEPRYSLQAGILEVASLTIGASGMGFPTGGGLLTIADTVSRVVISKELRIGERGRLEAPEGTVIVMTGSDFDNQSANPLSLADLAGIIFRYPGTAAETDTFEVAGTPGGGFDLNFAIGGLELAGLADVQLLDARDNNLSGTLGDECLYLRSLAITESARLDLRGLDLFVAGNVEAAIDAWVASGQLFDSTLGPGWWLDAAYDPASGTTSAAALPEPATLALVALGCLALLRRARP